MPFTEKQRRWIIARDDERSQMRHYSEESGWHVKNPSTCRHCGGEGCQLHVHHIVPQRVGGEDSPYNGITLYQCEHIGRTPTGLIDPSKEFVVHPDMIDAFKNYDGTNSSFISVFRTRDALARVEIPFHNTDHDVEMLQTATERTDNKIMSGHPWPIKRRRC